MLCVSCHKAFPETLELRPNSSATVRLAFRPPRDGQYYVQELMLLAALKAQRSFRLVGEGQAVIPPWCVGLMVSRVFMLGCSCAASKVFEFGGICLSLVYFYVRKTGMSLCCQGQQFGL